MDGRGAQQQASLYTTPSLCCTSYVHVHVVSTAVSFVSLDGLQQPLHDLLLLHLELAIWVLRVALLRGCQYRPASTDPQARRVW